MNRNDLLKKEARLIIDGLNDLIREMYARNLYMTNWYGYFTDDVVAESSSKVGLENRGGKYEPLPNAADDGRIPWYLYWEIYWVMRNGPNLRQNDVILDAGGTSSLFSCYVGSLGVEVHSIDTNEQLVANGKNISEKMQWKMFSYCMDMRRLDFPDDFFDHAYSICVFEHLDFESKKRALEEIARCMKPRGILSITFDYRNPAPDVVGYGPDLRTENQFQTNEDIRRSFLSSQKFEVVGNKVFCDNGKSYLVNHKVNNYPYTFGAVFLRRKS